MTHRQSATSYDAAGPVGAPAIMFVHGTRVNRKMWLPQVQGLADDYRVLAMDLPGHGALADARFGLEAAMEAMTGVLDQEAADRALLVGSSLGGYMSLEFAGRLPDRVAGLVLSGCSLNIRGAAALPFQIGARVLGRVSERWLIRVHEELCRRMFPPAFAEPIIEAGFSFKAVPDALQVLIGKDFLLLLWEFAGPVLFLNGQRDRIFCWNQAAFVAAARDGRLQVIPRGSHRCNLEYPEAFTEALRGFARSISW